MASLKLGHMNAHRQRRAGIPVCVALLLLGYAASAQGQALTAPALEPSTGEVLEDERIDVSGANPVFARGRAVLTYDWREFADAQQGHRLRLRLQQPFGGNAQYSWQLELPLERRKLESGERVGGLSDVSTRLNWIFYRTRSLRQNATLGIQWDTARASALSANHVLIQPQYGLSYAISDEFVASAQMTYTRSFRHLSEADRIERVSLESTATFFLPNVWSCSITPRVQWNLLTRKWGTSARFTIGFVRGAKREWEFDTVVEIPLNQVAQKSLFKYRIGFDVVRYF